MQNLTKFWLFFFSDNYIQKLIESEDYDTLQDILLAGYDKLDPVLEKLTEQQASLSEEAQKFMAEIPEFKVLLRISYDNKLKSFKKGGV